MDFSPEQDGAMMAVHKWLQAGDSKIFRLFGYAGTGKTTLARHIAENVDGDVLFAAFTGKAAQVLRSKGAPKASTIHSLIYRPRGEELSDDANDATPLFSLNRSSPVADAALVVIDECSMVDEELGRDLLSFGTPILVLGDPGQLPPVSGAGFFTNHEPDILLEEIHRQARGNPIIDLAQQIRLGGDISYGQYGDSKVISKREVDQAEVLAANQVLVGTNRTRRTYNQRLRFLRGFEGNLPVAHDKLVALRNNNEKGLLNGSLWKVTFASSPRKNALHLMVESEDEGMTKNTVKIKLLRDVFENPGTDIPWELKRRYDDFDFGYALTVHKSQGSQWDNLYLFDESYAFREHRARWLYTAITRAAETITIVR